MNALAPDTRFQHDAFFVDQLIRPVANLYRISTLAPGDGPGEPLAFVRQKKLAIREDIRFFADESEQEELFRLKARQWLEFRGRYDVVTPAVTAWDLHRAWPEARFVLVPDAGHAATEPGIAHHLIEATDYFARG